MIERKDRIGSRSWALAVMILLAGIISQALFGLASMIDASFVELLHML